MSKYKPLKSFKTMKEKGLYVREQMQAEGLYVLEDYKGSAIPMKCRIMVGEYKGYLATATWNNFAKGKRPDFRGLMEKEKFIQDKFEAEGYRVTRIPDNIKVTDKIDLISPEGNKWSVSYDTFRTGVRCPLDNYKSWGERCVASILTQNGLDFKTQHVIRHPDGSLQYMDFYIELKGKKFNIEYHGRQHYVEDPKNQLFACLEDQQKADIKKMRYCEDNGIEYVEIPYTLDTPKLVARVLNMYIPEVDPEKDYKVGWVSISKSLAEYYMTHTERETAIKFGVSGSTVRKTAYRLGYRKKGNYNEKEILNYFKTHPAQDTADKFGVTKHTVNGVAKKYGFKKGGRRY
ncbi:hypothetical protein Goe7_c00830 [Bacillus phage vB_BveM-Goe7]|nr:hypothetical protein Goe7_c00830 [Bacillus phage vB_BveM-Goe7]